MKTILSYLGFNQATSTRNTQLASLSIVSRQSVLVVLAVFLTMFSGTAWADYTVTFNTSGSVGIASGGSYVSSTSTTGYLTYGDDGMQFGSNGNSGAYEMTLSASGQVKATKITVKDLKKPSSNGGNLNYVITYSGGSTTSGSITTGTDADDADITLDATKTITKIKFNASASKKRFFVKGFTVVAAAATCTLHHGAGGSSTTNKTQGSGTLGSGNAVAGWTFQYWCVSSFADSDYGNHGTTYNSSATTPAQANLYAVYCNTCTGRFSTSPAAYYHIMSMEPAVTGGDDDDYFYTTVGGNNSVFCNITSGTTVYLTGHIGTGHSFHEWHVTKTDDASTTVTVTNPTAYDGTAYFTMPAYNIDIEADFCRSLNGEDVTVTQTTTQTATTIAWECDDAKYYSVAIKNPEGDKIYEQADAVSCLGTGISIDTLRPLTTYRLQICAYNSCMETSAAKRSEIYDEYFTTLGYTVTYNTNGGGGTTPTDATEYGDGASVELLNKNNNTSKDDTFFAGWTDNSSGTGTIYKPGDTYTITSNVTFYAKWIDCSSSNTPQNVTITNDNTSSVTVSWDAVTDATKYVVEILGDALSEKHDFEITAPTVTKTITNSDASADDYIVMVTPYIDNIALCPSSIEMFTLSAGCPNYSFHYQHSSDWNTDDICFTQVSTSVNYLTDELSLPYAEWYNVTGSGNGGHGASDAYTYGFTGTTDNTPMPFYHYRSKSFGANPQSGNIGGGLGRFHVYGDSDSKNKYVSFIPTYYTLNFGTGDTWTNDSTLVLSPESSDWDETDFYTPITTLTNAAIGRKIFVGLKTSSGYVWCSPYSVKENLSGLRTKSGSGNNWVDGGLTTSYASKRGKFRVYANSGDNNWYVTFIPHHRIIYHANYPVGDSPADTYSVDVSVEETNSSISLNSAPAAPTGYTFDGWYTAASGGTKRTGNQTISAGASADVELHAHWTLNTHSVTYSAPSNGDYTISVAGGSATSETKDADYGQTVTLAATGNTGYEFSSWTVTGATSGDEITVSNNQFTMPDEDVTVVATFTAIDYNVTYSAPSNGNYTIKVASGTASSATKTANYGQTITLAATPSEG